MSSYEGLCPDCQQIECDDACMKVTNNVELLTLPEDYDVYGANNKNVQDYARANIEASTKYYRDMLCQSQDDVMKLSAETEALRAERDEARRAYFDAVNILAPKADQAERLAEALRDLEVCANTVDLCYTRNPGNFAVALRELRESAERSRAAALNR